MRQQKELNENRLRVEAEDRRFEADRRERREKEAAEQISRETREQAESKEVRIKHFGDILKRVMTQMPANVMDVPMYLEGVERMFVEYSVPADIQTVLLNPYLSDKAKRLMVRLPVTETRTYDGFKAALLKEFSLTATKYRDNFMSAVKDNEETWTQYGSRLTTLLKYYLDSRKVTNYDKLTELLVSDRMKEGLPHYVNRHTGAKKNDDWLTPHALVRVADCMR